MSESINTIVQGKINDNKVMVFSKSYCPYCTRAKETLNGYTNDYETLELDNISNGDQIQAELARLTKQRTVPNIFIGGKHIGGCDSLVELHRNGALRQKLEEAGIQNIRHNL